ncbi:LPXTG cell wall anchor domain-containing protein [Streptomyces sp. JNUCC 64]
MPTAPGPAGSLPLPGDGARPDAFPLTVRTEGAPAAYRSGAPPAEWSLTVVNRTATAFRPVYPVVVLADARRALRPGDVRLELHDGSRWRPARIARTDRDEHVAVPDDGFAGYAVGPRGTLTVRLRLAFAPGAAPDEVTADTVVVHRRGDDGDWVGAAPRHAFRVTAPADPPADPPSSGPSPGAAATAPDGFPTGPYGTASPVPAPHELAMTGQRASALVAGAAALLLAGTALYLTMRRRHPPGPGR